MWQSSRERICAALDIIFAGVATALLCCCMWITGCSDIDDGQVGCDKEDRAGAERKSGRYVPVVASYVTYPEESGGYVSSDTSFDYFVGVKYLKNGGYIVWVRASGSTTVISDIYRDEGELKSCSVAGKFITDEGKLAKVVLKNVRWPRSDRIVFIENDATLESIGTIEDYRRVIEAFMEDGKPRYGAFQFASFYESETWTSLILPRIKKSNDMAKERLSSEDYYNGILYRSSPDQIREWERRISGQ